MSDEKTTESPAEIEPGETEIDETEPDGTLVQGPNGPNGLGFLRDVPLDISVEIGRRRMVIGDVLELGPSSVIELDKAAGEALDVRVNGILVARGEAVVVSDRFGIRLTSLLEPKSLLDSLTSS